MIPFAQFAPDRSDFDPEASDTIRNVIPRGDGYGPFPGFVALTSALEARPQGAIMVRHGSGYRIFAGTVDKLWEMNQSDLDWDDKSKAATTYAVPAEGAWSFTVFGDLLIAADRVDATQKFALTAGTTFDDLGGGPPKAAYVGVAGDFLFHLNVEASSRQANWSGLNSPEFYTLRQRGCDFQMFPDGGAIQGFAGFERGGLIFQEGAIREMVFALTTPQIMNFVKTRQSGDEEGETKGAVAPRAIVQAGDAVFYLAMDGFYRYGIPSQPIGFDRVNEFFLADCLKAAIPEVQGAADPIRQLVYWRYRSNAHPNANTTDRVLIYHYGRDRWALANMELSWLLPVATPGFTLEGLDALGYTLDSLPFSLDSRAWAGGSPLIGGFDASYRLGLFSGAPLEAVLQTADVPLNPGSRTFVSGFSPITDADDATGRVAAKARHSAPRSWGASAGIQRTGLIPARIDGALHRFEVTIPAGTTWEVVSGVEPEQRASGRQ